MRTSTAIQKAELHAAEAVRLLDLHAYSAAQAHATLAQVYATIYAAGSAAKG